MLLGLSAQAGSADAPLGRKTFADHRNPPSYRPSTTAKLRR
jgi:hypothetical protein